MTQNTKDLLTYAGAGAVGALIARNFARGVVGMLLGASSGVALAAFVIAHPKATTATGWGRDF